MLPGARLKLCSQLSLAAGMWALGITLCFRLHLLAPLLKAPLPAARKAPHPPAFSLSQFLRVAASGVEGICVCCRQPLAAVLCCVLAACSALRSAWDGHRALLPRRLQAVQPPRSLVGRSSGAPCPQHCPGASWRQAGCDPLPSLLNQARASGLGVPGSPKRPCKGFSGCAGEG